MPRIFFALLFSAAVAFVGSAAAAKPSLPAAINEAPRPTKVTKGLQPGLVRAQILLDRARFSPGEIDGRPGDNLSRAIAAFAAARSLQTSADPSDDAVWNALVSSSTDPVIVETKLTASDVRGPFVRKLPHKLEQLAELRRVGYRDVAEKLGERYHVSPALLKALNPGKKLRAGETIFVPAVDRPREQRKAARIEVDKENRLVRVFDGGNALLAVYLSSIGSETKPAPSGHFEVASVAVNPTYTYNPNFAFKGVKADEPFEIAPGPNNPVGTVWIDLTAETYGIHGTPEPGRIGKTGSNGCVRLTNWDAQDLSHMVKKGVAVDFLDPPATASALKPAGKTTASLKPKSVRTGRK